MSPELRTRLLTYATAHRADPRWKRVLYALLYGCDSLRMLNTFLQRPHRIERWTPPGA